MSKDNFVAEESAIDFLPSLIRLQDKPPNPLGQRVLWMIFLLIIFLIIWALIGRLDIVAVAEGKLVPKSHLKIVQPSESGIVKEILVSEGEAVLAGQVLIRMDALNSVADAKALAAEYQRNELSLRRIDAELSGSSLDKRVGESTLLFDEIKAQFKANRISLEATKAAENSHLLKTKQDLLAAEQQLIRLKELLPHYRGQAAALDKLSEDGHASSIMVSDKKRELIEKEQEFKTQKYVIESTRASIDQSNKRLTKITSDYRRRLYIERNQVAAAMDKLAQEITKQTHRQSLLELRAPQDAFVKDLATHTIGTVVQPGTVMLTLVPRNEELRAEVWISNKDIGFIGEGQLVRLKFAAYAFQKYGLLEGVVERVSVDAMDKDNGNLYSSDKRSGPLMYKALIRPLAMSLDVEGITFPLNSGMQASAEILLGTRTVMEFLLSPLSKAWHEAGRER